MTATQQYNEDAIKGGFKPSQMELKHWEQTSKNLHPVDYHRIVSYVLLDPLVWKAAGKTREWDTYISDTKLYGSVDINGCWKEYWREFFDHLADGKSIEEALGLLR